MTVPAGPAARPVEIMLIHEYLQHTGSFKARGAANLAETHRLAASMPKAGVCIASGGNAGLACAWAARAAGVAATVFVPVSAPAVKLARLRGYGADVRLVGADYAEASLACQDYAERTGALLSHAYDNPLIAAGAGTCAADALDQLAGGIDTFVVAVGGGGLLAGTVAASRPAGCRVVGVEPASCMAMAAALSAGHPVDVAVDSIAADSLGARRLSGLAYAMATEAEVHAVQVSDQAIVAARLRLWQDSRIVVEHGGATAFAALLAGSYQPEPDERVAVILCGANTDPTDLVAAGG
ncbi:MAG: serine/threonine dehydratase [Jatrophihabitantaceae bacterium]